MGALLCVVVLDCIGKVAEGWRDGSALKSTLCSCRGPRFSTHHPLGGSQLPGTPVPGTLMLFFATPGGYYKDLYVNKTSIHIKYN